MAKFYIESSWTQTGFYIIEAESEEEAREIAGDPHNWTGKHAHIDQLPPPQCETMNDDWALDDDTLREATPEEIATAEALSWKEALAVTLEALQRVATNPRVMETMLTPQDAAGVATAITAAEKALAA